MTDRDDRIHPENPSDDPTTPAGSETDAASTGTASFAPLRGRPVLPHALGTRSDHRADPGAEVAHGSAAADDAPGSPDVDAAASTADGESQPVESALAEVEHSTASPTATGSSLAAEAPVEGAPDVGEADAPPATGVVQKTTAPPQTNAPSASEPTDAVPIGSDDDPDQPSSLEGAVALDEPSTTRRRMTGGGAIAVGARALAGVLGVLVAVGVITAATVLPAPLYSIEPPETLVSPVAAAQQRVCPGPLLRLGDDQGQGATVATSVGRAASEYQAAPRTASADALAETENTAGVAPQVLTLPPGPEPADALTALAGSQSQSIESGDLLGLAAAQCVEASGDSWLVGGSTDVGRTTLLTLTNPTTVIATVDLAIFGTAGEVVAPGTVGIVVPAGSQRIFSLAGFAPQLVSPVVHVVSRGGLVVANLQQTTVRTLQPGGVDFVGATRAPARALGIPGLLVSGADEITDAQGDPGNADLQTTLRFFVPGEEGTTASVTITPARGNDGPSAVDSVTVEGAEPGVAPGSATFELELLGGRVTEVPVPGLSDGEYSVDIDAAAPIVAGARVSTLTPDGATDFAWLPAGGGLDDRVLVSIAPGPTPVLRMLNPTDEDREVTLAIEGVETTLELEAGEAVPTSVPAGEDIRLSGAAGMLATVTYAGVGQLSAFGVTSPGPASGDLVISR